MLDLLAAIVSADPPALVAWLVLAFAAGMYPVGIMLGSSCSPCCGQPCNLCTEGSLPETVTVSISGYVDDQVQGPDLTSLSFASDFGGDAAGRVTAPGGTPGPITAVSLTSGGSGYARIARVQPTVTASASEGSGAEFSVTLQQTEHDGRAAWYVDSLSVTDGGTGYPATGSIAFDVESGDTEVAAASAIYHCDRTEPTVSLSVDGAGTAAVLEPTLTYYAGGDFWYVSGVTISNGGSGYSAGDPVAITLVDGDSDGVPFSMTVNVDGSGAVVGVAVDNPFPYYAPWNRGSYYVNTGIIQSVTLSSGGIFYRDDPALPGETASVTVGVNGPGGSGAAFTVVIDDDADSPTFGQITAVDISNGGSGYIAWRYRNVACCEDYYNGLSVVLRRTGACTYSKTICGTDCAASVNVEYRGPSTPAIVSINAPGTSCGNALTASSLVTDCSSFSFTATNESGVSATVSPGGTFDADDKADDGSGRCFPCCRGDSAAPGELEVELYAADYEGNFAEVPITAVLARVDSACGSNWRGRLYSSSGPMVGVSISQCSDPYTEGCDYCWKKCQTMATVQYGWPWNLGCTLHFNSEACSSCADSPMCAPVPEEYICDIIYNPSGFCSDGHSKWKVVVP